MGMSCSLKGSKIVIELDLLDEPRRTKEGTGANIVLAESGWGQEAGFSIAGQKVFVTASATVKADPNAKSVKGKAAAKSVADVEAKMKKLFAS